MNILSCRAGYKNTVFTSSCSTSQSNTAANAISTLIDTNLATGAYSSCWFFFFKKNGTRYTATKCCTVSDMRPSQFDPFSAELTCSYNSDCHEPRKRKQFTEARTTSPTPPPPCKNTKIYGKKIEAVKVCAGVT